MSYQKVLKIMTLANMNKSFYVDPNKVTDFNRSESDLELFLLFCIVVAGKTAKTQAKLLEGFLTNLRDISKALTGKTGQSPFKLIYNADSIGALRDELIRSRLGQFNRLEKSFRKTHDFLGKMKTITREELETIPGIGPKTSRFYLLHSRPNQRMAVLDTHILHYMRDNGLTTLTITPDKKKYGPVEEAFLNHAKSINKTIADLDLEIWKKYSGNV